MKTLVSLTKKAATFLLLAVVLIGTVPPAPAPDPDTPGITEPGKPGTSDENGKEDKGDDHGASPYSDRGGKGNDHKN